MDIYNFIRSKDVADYCRSMGKIWNTCEMAIIVARSDRMRGDKYQAWMTLINEYPDIPAIKKNNCIEFDSIHEKLKKIIRHEKYLDECLENPEPNTSYRYKVWWNRKEQYSDTVFSTYEKALEDLHESWEADEAQMVTIEKNYHDFDEKRPVNNITARIDYNGNLYGLYASINEDVFQTIFPGFEDDTESCLSDGFYVDIPTSFKRGDILIRTSIYLDEPEVFVLDKLDRDDPRYFERCINGESGDGWGLTGWGYFITGNGVLYGDHVHDHDSFMYFEGKLDRNERLLHYVSLFVKDEIALPELLTMQCRIVAEHMMNNDLRIDTHGCHIPESLLVENRLTEKDKKELEETGGLMPWVADKLSVHQIEFLVREFDRDKETVQFELQNGGGFYLGLCAGIVHDENHYARTGDTRFNPPRKEMARMILEAYGWTENGWIDSWADKLPDESS